MVFFAACQRFFANCIHVENGITLELPFAAVLCVAAVGLSLVK